MKYIQFRKLIKTPIFTTQTLKNSGATYTPSQLTMWQQKGYIAKLRGGIYAFTDSLPTLTPAILSHHLVSPSYISLSAALSHHGIIPEAVFSTTCVTSKGTRTYTTSLGRITYQHIPPRIFFGYERITGGLLPYNLAQPEKALLDFFYLTPSVKNKNDLIELRLNLGTIEWDRLREYLLIFRRTRLNHLIKILEKEHAHR